MKNNKTIPFLIIISLILINHTISYAKKVIPPTKGIYVGLYKAYGNSDSDLDSFIKKIGTNNIAIYYRHIPLKATNPLRITILP